MNFLRMYVQSFLTRNRSNFAKSGPVRNIGIWIRTFKSEIFRTFCSWQWLKICTNNFTLGDCHKKSEHNYKSPHNNICFWLRSRWLQSYYSGVFKSCLDILNRMHLKCTQRNNTGHGLTNNVSENLVPRGSSSGGALRYLLEDVWVMSNFFFYYPPINTIRLWICGQLS